MGIVFGVTGVKEPAFNMLLQSPVEIREYASYVVAEVPMKHGADNDAFPSLAKYIGVFGEPQNSAKKSIAMTAPVITESQKIAMTAPVVTNSDKMSFVLPEEFKSVDDAPVPTDSNVKVKLVPAQTVAVSRFSGWYTDAAGSKHLHKLSMKLKEHGILESTMPIESLDWCVAQYHPPFTLPFLRRNEVWVVVDKDKVPIDLSKRFL